MKYFFVILFSFSLFFPFVTFAQEPQNLAEAKKIVIAYHDSGEYETDIAKVVKQAKKYLIERLRASKNNKKLAIVFDIDETVISNYEGSKALNFGGTMDQINKMTVTGDKPAIEPVKELYYFAKKHKIALFFVTGRPVSQYEVTKKMLKKAGYHGWTKLYMEPENYRQTHKSVVDYKAKVRKEIEENLGYDIVLSIGDQYSDIEGGYADKGFKLPNPYYFVA